MNKIILSFIFIFLYTSVNAQFGRMGKMDKEDRTAAFERIENYKKLQMVEVLKLNEELSLKVLSRYNKHRDAMKSLEKDRAAIIDKLESQIASNTSDAEYNKNFTELIDVERKILELRSKYLTELKEVLTTKQVAEYLVFERNFLRNIRDIARDIQHQRKEK